MGNGSVSSASAMVVEVEPREPSVIRLRGRMARQDASALDAAAAAALDAGAGTLVIDMVDLAGDAVVIVDVLNRVAAERIPTGRVMVVRVAATATPFPNGSLHSAILVEPMAAMPTVPTAVRPAPATKLEASPGVVRREGRGFVASYGTGRQCSAVGCETLLSRYNERSVCNSHMQPER